MRSFSSTGCQLGALVLAAAVAVAAVAAARATPPRNYYNPGHMRCPHVPNGCCVHDLTNGFPGPFCNQACQARTNRCHISTPGGSVGIR